MQSLAVPYLSPAKFTNSSNIVFEIYSPYMYNLITLNVLMESLALAHFVSPARAELIVTLYNISLSNMPIS